MIDIQIMPTPYPPFKFQKALAVHNDTYSSVYVRETGKDNPCISCVTG